MEGFAIRCPHCQEWSRWSEHPKTKALESVSELEQILEQFNKASLKGEQKNFSHPKLLRCKSSPRFCPVSFEAFICRGDEDPHEYSKNVESWSLKRHFRLRKTDTQNLWEKENEGKYSCVLLNTQQIQRQRYIELESLMDRELVSRLIAGMSMEIDLPLTFFAANIFEPNNENKNAERHWTPIEGYSHGRNLVPPRYSSFCEVCRNLSMKKLVKEFDEKGYDVNNCPIKFGKNRKCVGKEAACIQEPKDWNHCPFFLEERKEKCPCYNSDVTHIEIVKDLWRNEKVPSEGIWRRCHAGFYEIAFPIEVHGHLVCVAMTGQLFFEPDDIKRAEVFVRSKKVGEVEDIQWDTLVGEVDELKKARQILVGLELYNKEKEESKFLMNRAQAEEKIGRLRPNLERFEKSLESHYRDFRVKLEFAFRKEIIAYIRKHKEGADFFEEPIKNVLKRMCEFWAFKAVGFLCYSEQTKNLSIISYSHDTEEGIEEKGFGFPGEEVGTIDSAPQKKNPLGWFYDPNDPEAPQNPWLKKLLPLFEDTRDNPNINLPKEGGCFFVVVPSGDEVYIFALMARDIAKVCRLEGRKLKNVSELCQEYMLKTCTEVIREFDDIRAFTEQRNQVCINLLHELEKNIENNIDMNISVTRDLLIEDLLKDVTLSNELKKSILEIKSRDGKIKPVIRKCFEEEYEKLEPII
jgi:hypothetical protein